MTTPEFRSRHKNKKKGIGREPVQGRDPSMTSRGQLAELLRDTNFRRIWLTGMASGVSRWLELLVVGIYAFETTGSPFLVALMIALRLSPLVFFGTLVGTLADRLSPRRFMIGGMAWGLFVSFVMFLLFFFGVAEYWMVAIGAVGSGIVWTLDMPLRRRMLGDIAGKDRLVTGLSFESATNNSTRLFGPLLGGFLYAALGPEGTFALSSLLFAFGLSMILRTSRGLSRNVAVSPPGRIVTEIREGFGLALHNPDILRILMVTVVYNIWAMPFVSMIPVIGSEQMQLSPAWIGIIASLEGVGALVGGLAIAMTSITMPFRWIYFGGVFLYMAFAFVASLMFHALPMAMLVFMVGLCAAGFSSMQSTLTYTVAPPNMRSRLFGLVVLCIGTGLIGAANIGLMGEWFGGANAVRIGAAEGMIVLFLLGISWRELRAGVRP